MSSQAARFLVVINIQDLFNDDKFGRVTDDYHNKLKELFGEANYRAVIPTLHFVLTHNDKTPGGEPHTAKDVEKRLKGFMMSFLTSRIKNPLLPEFIKRIISHNMMVDYAHQDQRMLLEQLSGFFAQADGGGAAPPHVDAGRLDVHANELNSKCVATMKEKIDTLKAASADRQTTVAGLLKKVQSAGQSASDIYRELESKKMRARETHESRKQNRTALSELEESLPKLKNEIEEAKVTIVTIQQQQEFVRQELTQIASVSLRADVARQKGGVFSFKTVIQLEGCDDDTPIIVVVGSEPGDKTVVSHMDNDGSLIPADITTAQNFMHQSVVWFNSYRKHHNRAKVNGQMRFDRSTGLTEVDFEAREEFKVLIYTKADFKLTPASKLLSDHFDTLFADANAKQSQLEQEEEAALERKKKLRRGMRDSKIALKEQRGAVVICKDQMDAAEKRFKDACVAAKQGIEEGEREAESLCIGSASVGAADGMQALKGDVDVSYIFQIAQIFQRNELQTDLTTYIQTYEAGLADMRTNVHKAQADLDRCYDEVTKASEAADQSDDDWDDVEV